MNPRTVRSDAAPSQPTLLDVLITIAVGVVVAIWLDRPMAVTGTAPAPMSAGTSAAAGDGDPAPFTGNWAGTPPLAVASVDAEALAADSVLRALRDNLSAHDVAALAGRVGPGPASFEVWDLAERSEPWAGDVTAATVLFDGLLAAVDATPRIAGWFHYDDPAPGSGPPARILGVVTCCWRRDSVNESAPAGWLVEVLGTHATLRQWVWLGGPGDGAAVSDLVLAWAASGAWDPEPGAAEPRIRYITLTRAPAAPGRAAAARPE